MAGSTENPRIWLNADVYVADVDTTAPTGVADDWVAGWEALGLLSQDGMTESRDETVNDHFAWGGILVRTTRSNHKRSFVVTALEDNPVVFHLVNPGSEADTAGDVTTRTVKIPGVDIRAFGLELRDGDITKRRIVPRGEVVEVGDITRSESDMEMYELTINVYPDGEGVLYYDITDDPQAVEAAS
jgi:hypothetical protein